MSFQAYLDNIEEKIGKTPNEFIVEAKKKGLTQSKEIADWLKKQIFELTRLDDAIGIYSTEADALSAVGAA